MGGALSFRLPLIVQRFDKIFKEVVLNLLYFEVHLTLVSKKQIVMRYVPEINMNENVLKTSIIKLTFRT